MFSDGPLVAHPTVLPVERTLKRSTSVVHGLAPRDYRHTGLGSMGLLTTAVWRLPVILSRFVTPTGLTPISGTVKWASDIVNQHRRNDFASGQDEKYGFCA